MSNLTPEIVDVRLTETRNEFTEEHSRLWEGLEDEKVSRIAGDEANKQFTQQVQGENQGTESRLSTEVIHRSEGDLNNITSLNALAQAMSEYRIKTDLEIATEKLIRQQLGVDLDNKIDLAIASWDHDKFMIYTAIDEVQKDVDSKYTSMDIRIKKYEDMLQDITTDSIQITMDNGEINMGAWTILSQAREWDLEILAKFKGYTNKTDKDIQDALDDLISKLPIEQDIIDKAIEALSNAPIIKELDALLGSAIEDINRVDKGLVQEVTDRQNALIGMAQDNALKMQEQSDALTNKIVQENTERVDAIQRESAIRQQELLDEAANRTAEIDAKLKEVWTDIDAETAERLKQIEQLQDGLTTEIQHRKDGDASITSSLENYKASTDTTLANMQTSVNAAVTDSTAAVTKVDALDARFVTTEENAKEALANSAAAVEKANVAVTESTVAAEKVTALRADMSNIQNELVNKADASALHLLDTKLNSVDGKVTSNSNAITSLTGRVAATENGLATKADASALNDFYTKVQTDQAIAGSISTYNSSLVIGGENLLHNTQKGGFIRFGGATVVETQGQFKTTTYRATRLGNGDSGLAQVVSNRITKLRANTKYTLSFFARGTMPITKVNVFGAAGGSMGVRIEDLINFTGYNDTTFTFCTGTFTTTGDNEAAHVTISNFGGAADAWFEIAEVLLQEGTKATGWLPNSLDTQKSIDANASAIETTNTNVSNINGTLLSQGSRLTSLENTVNHATTGLATKASSAAVNSLDSKVSVIDGKVSTNSSNITTLTNKVAIVEGDLNKKADAAALNTLTNRVTETEKGLTTQSDNLVLLTNTVTNMGSYVALNSDSEGLETYNTTGEIVKVADNNATAGRILKLGNNSGDDHVWIHPPYFMPFEPSRMYRVKARFRRVSGSGTVYVGIACKNADKSSYVTTANTYSMDMGNSTYLYAGQTPALGVWQELEFFVSGASTGAASGGVTLANPKKLPALAAFITPMFIANYQSAAGVVELDYITIEQADTFPMLDAAATATSNLTTKVDTIDGKVTSNSSSITNLTNRVNTVEGQVKTKAEASALSALDSRVTKAEGNITSQSSSVTKLENRLDRFAVNGTNLLANSNKVSPYDGNYPHCVYTLGTDWDLTSPYTLVWCAEHKRASGDTTSVLAAYVGGGTQSIQSFPVNGDKQVMVARFTKLASSLGKFVNFYLLNRNNAATVATVYWAVLLKGNTEVVDSWIPSPFDYMNDTTALSKAQQTLDSKVVSIDGKVTANTASITSLQGRVTTAEGNINKKLDASVINAYSTTVETDKSIANAVSSYDASLVIGGNNLLYNTGPSVTTDRAWSFGAASGLVGINLIKDNGFYSELTGGTGTGDFTWKQTVPAVVKSGESVTLSVYADIKGSVQARLLVRFNYADGTNGFFSPWITTSQRAAFTALNNAVQDAVSMHIWLAIYPLTAGAKGSCLFTRPMLELGTKATAWNMGSAETDNSLTLNANAIKDTTARVTATEAEVKANSSDITALSNNLNGANLLKPFPETVAVGQAYEQISVPFKSPITYVPGDKLVVRGSLSFAQNTLPAGAGIAVYIEGSPRFTTIPLMRQGNNQYFEGDVVIDSGIAGRTANNLKLYLLPSGSSNSTTKTTLHWAELTLGGEVKASVAAVSSLETELNKQGGSINTLTNSTTRLESRVTTVEGKTESNIGAINTLNGKMSVAEGKIEANSTSLTKVNASISGLEDITAVKDTRSVNSPPSYYWTNYPMKVVNEFKQASVMGVSGYGTYVTVTTTVPWIDSSGGAIQQMLSNGNPAVNAYRYSSGSGTSATWTAWGQPIRDLQNGLNTKAEASALNSLDSKVSVIDGKVTTQASTITQLQSSVGANTSKLQVQGNVLNGIQAEYTIKTDVNGLVAGIGLINDGKSSAIGINADYFYIGKPASGKKPFIVTTSSQTIGGVTYPAGTWIDVALIANATIGTAKIADLAVTNAKIADLAVDNAKISNLSADKINAGTINAARIGAKSITADKINVSQLSAISADLGTIKVDNAHIEDLAVSSLKIQNEAVTVPSAVTNLVEKSIPTMLTPQSYGDWKQVLRASGTSLGDCVSITVNRSGGKCRVDGNIVISDFAVTTTRQGGLISGVAKDLLCGIVLLKNGNPIAEYIVGSPSSTFEDVALFNAAVQLPAFIDSAGTGNTKYTLQLGFTTKVANGGVAIHGKQSGYASKILTATVSTLELKK